MFAPTVIHARTVRSAIQTPHTMVHIVGPRPCPKAQAGIETTMNIALPSPIPTWIDHEILAEAIAGADCGDTVPFTEDLMKRLSREAEEHM
jgi:hypothetical protein